MKNEKAKKLMVYCMKGGTGKSTVVMNVGKELAKKGYKVLICDEDPQANISKTLLGSKISDDDYVSMRELFIPTPVSEEMINKAIYNVSENLDIIGSHIEISQREIEVQSNYLCERNLILDKVLKKIENKYDLILMDFNPYPSLAFVNGVMACDKIIIPTSCEEWGAEGVAGTISLIMQVNQGYEKKTDYKVLVNLCGRTKDDKAFLDEIYKQLDEDEIFKTRIRYQAKPFKDKSKSVLEYMLGGTAVGQEWASFLKEVEEYIFENQSESEEK